MKITTRWRRGLTLLLITSMTLSVLSVLPAFPAPVQAVGFNPDCKVDLDPSQAERGKIFSASIVCERLQRDHSLFAYQGQLRYNPAVVNVKLPFDPLQDTICDPDLVGACDSTSKLQFDDLAGLVNWEIVLTGYPFGFAGTALLLKINFVVLVDKGTSPMVLGGDCASKNETDQMCILDGSFNNIPHTETDATFRVGNAFVTTSPSIILKPVGTKFDVFVNVGNVEGLFAHTGMLKYNPAVIQVQPNGLSLEGTICELEGSCIVDQLQFNDLTGEITWEIVLIGYPTGFSTDPAGPGKTANLVKITFVVVDDTGTSLLEFKENPKTGSGPCDQIVVASDEICLLDSEFDEIPHNEDNGSFGVFQTMCHIDPDPSSGSIGNQFSVDLMCDDVQGLFAFSGMLTSDPSIIRVVGVTRDAPGLVCGSGGCEEFPSFNDLTGEIFFEIVLTGYPVGFSGDARLLRIAFEVVDDTGTSPIRIHGECLTKGDPDQMCILDPSLNLPGIPHAELNGTFNVGPAIVRVQGLSTCEKTPDPSVGCIIRSVGETFDASVMITTTRGIFGHGGTLMYQTEMLDAIAANVTMPGTTCFEASCEVTDLTVNDAAGEVTWELTDTGRPRGFTGTAALIIVTFQVTAKGMTLLELKSPPGHDCPPGELDQVCLLDETLSPAPHMEVDGLFSVNTPANPTADLLPRGPLKVGLGQKQSFGAYQSVDNNSPPETLTRYDFSINGVLTQSSGSFFFSFTPSAEGTYVVSVVVCDESRLCSKNSAFTVLDVNPPPKRPPVSDFVWDSDQDGVFESGKIFINQSVTFKSTGFDPQNQTLISWGWDFNGDGTTDASGPMVKHVFTQVRIHTVSLTVCNESKICETEPKDIEVNSLKLPPTAVISGPGKVTSGSTVVYSGTGSHDNSIPPQTLTYTWFDKISGQVLGNATTVSVHFGQSKGTFALSLTVCNTSNLCDTDNLLITVNPLPFVADLIMPVAAYATEPASFTVSVSGGSPPYTCTIDFGDGSLPLVTPCTNGQVITHTYALTGTYTVQFRAIGANPGEDTGTITKTLSVQPEPLFIHNKLSWKHHLTTVTQTFNAKASNPSKYTVTIRVIVTLTKPDGTVDQANGNFTLGPGAQSTNLPFTYSATMLGKYCFAATMQYLVDANNDGTTDVTGTAPNTKSGCFTRV